jgi:hypothetical protein
MHAGRQAGMQAGRSKINSVKYGLRRNRILQYHVKNPRKTVIIFLAYKSIPQKIT